MTRKPAFIFVVLLAALALVFSQAGAAPSEAPAAKKTPVPQQESMEDQEGEEIEVETEEDDGGGKGRGKEKNKNKDKGKGRPESPGNSQKSNPGQGKPEDKGKPEDRGTGKPEQDGKRYNFKGVVASTGGDGLTIIDRKTGAEVDFQLEDPVYTPEGSPPPQVGDQVIVQAVRDSGVYKAVRVHLFPNKPVKIHRVGIVTAFGGGQITVQNKKGQSTVFQLAPDVAWLPDGRSEGEIVVGETRVTVISPRDPNAPAGELPVAAKIVIHPAK